MATSGEELPWAALMSLNNICLMKVGFREEARQKCLGVVAKPLRIRARVGVTWNMECYNWQTNKHYNVETSVECSGKGA